MDPVVVSVLLAAGTVSGLVLFVYFLCRLVLAAKKVVGTGTGGKIVGMALIVLGVLAPVPPPPREIATESRQLKRNQDDGDPP